MSALADCISEVYAIESAILQAARPRASRGEAAAKQAVAMTKYYTT
jgi:hypothetical protein